ncbi:MAG: ATPase/DNA packaging protein [Castellaniella sp.]
MSQKTGIGIVNYYKQLPKKYVPKHRQKHPLAPLHPFQMIIAGPTGAGKTNIVMHLINRLVDFDKLYIYAKNLDEPLYKELTDRFRKLEKELIDDAKKEAFAKGHSLEHIADKYKILTTANSMADIPDPTDFDKNFQHFVIIDDMITDSKKAHNPVEQLYTYGRKNNVSIVYLSQNYADIPDNIRKNANYIAFIKIDNKREQTEMHKTHASRVDKDQFMQIVRSVNQANSDHYQKTGEQGMHFMLIDKKTQYLPLHLRMDFDHIHESLVSPPPDKK